MRGQHVDHLVHGGRAGLGDSHVHVKGEVAARGSLENKSINLNGSRSIGPGGELAPEVDWPRRWIGPGWIGPGFG